MGFRKSTTCIGKTSKAPVTEYDSPEEARQSAEHSRLDHGMHLVPYQCDRCQLWHLAPKDRQTPSRTCHHCRGADGRPKEAYASEQDAQRRAAILRSERGLCLRVYACQYGQGWHLTKGSGQRAIHHHQIPVGLRK